MLEVMAKKPKHEQPKLPAGRSPVITIRLGHEREAAVAVFIEKQKVKPEKTAVILAALDKFLAEEGLWPNPPQGTVT